MNKINIFLENLNARERILYFILIILIGIFTGLKLGEIYTNDDLTDDSTQILLQNSQLKTAQLNQKLNTLNSTIQNQNQELTQFDKAIQILNQNYKNYMSVLHQKANANSLYFKDLNTQTTQIQNLQIHRLNLNFQSSFTELYKFLQELNNDALFFNIEKIYVENKEEYLDITLEISFITLNFNS